MKMAFRAMWMRVKNLIRTDREFEAEMEAHVAMQTDENIRAGMPEHEARRAAMVKFGHLTAVKEAYRDQRSIPQVETTIQDLRYGMRTALRHPLSSAVIILSLAIAIGLNTTLFTWLKAVYLDPLPGVANARELVTISAGYKFGDGYSNSYEDFLYYRTHSRSFQDLFAHEMDDFGVSDGNSSQMTVGGIVSGNYFADLGVKMELGRALSASDDQKSAAPAVVIADSLWRARFGASKDIVGRTIKIKGAPFSVIGVAASPFMGVYGGFRQDLWIPLHALWTMHADHADPLEHGIGLQLMGRPAHGVAIAAIQQELNVLAGQDRVLNHKSTPDYRALVYPLHEAQRGIHSSLFQMVKLLFVVVLALLILACCNAANLLIGRATERSREFAVRMSIGAGRGRIVRQLLTESLVLSAVAAALGLLIVYATRAVPLALVPADIPVFLNAGIDWRVVVFLFAISMLTTAAFGLVPALETGRVEVNSALKEGSGATTAHRRRGLLRKTLVCAQISLATASLFASALFIAYVRRVEGVPKGFSSERLLTAQADLTAAGVEEARGARFYPETLGRLRHAPGVVAAAWTSFLPMSGSGGGNTEAVTIPGHPALDGNPYQIVTDTVSDGYLSTMGIRLLHGREFLETDTAASTPVVLVTNKFAQVHFGGHDPVGQAITVGKEQRTIVGVYADYVYRDPAWPASDDILIPLSQAYRPSAIAVVRTAGNPHDATNILRGAVREFDRNIPVSQVITMDENVAFRFASNRMGMNAILFLAAVACLLAAIGIYGVMATFVIQRRKEFGIRIALGASPGEVRRRVVAQTVILGVVGVACGFGLSVALGLAARAVLYGSDPANPALYAAAFAAVAVIVAASATGPAASAGRLQPMTALRAE